jgi:threonine dehydrogenase-like Zn-dependent dehydrogenase
MKKLGVHHTIDNNNPDALKKIMEITNGEGVNATIEAVGSAYTFRQSIDACGFAARAVYVGYANADISLDTSQIVKKELDVLGSRNALTEFQDVIDMLEEDIFDTEMLITGVYPMQEIDEAFQLWKNKPGEVIKILTQIN